LRDKLTQNLRDQKRRAALPDIEGGTQLEARASFAGDAP
jgi:hypothetical protein